MNRRDLIKDIFTVAPSEKLAAANSAVPTPEPQPERIPAGPVRSMGLALDRMEYESRALHEALSAGVTIVELDTSLIESSFVRDRLAELDGEFEAFKRSIAENGQHVPILVRPHPRDDGTFQIAFGHRRNRACAALGIKVRAIVRAMSDQELVVAQGLENAQRKDLSYIERALYAAKLEDRGFERAVICDSLNTDKSELSKLLSVARAVPELVITAIGPAPKTGRRRWLALAELLDQPGAVKRAGQVAQDPDLEHADSDRRFLRVFAALNERALQKETVVSWKSPTGSAAATVTRNAKAVSLTFDRRAEPEFAEFVASQLDELYAAFQSQAKAGDGA